MISNYNPNKYGTHVVRVTFMEWDYVGHVSFKIGGNCKGGNLLTDDFLEYVDGSDIAKFVENDCDFCIDDEEEMFFVSLTNQDGDILDCEWGESDAKNAIVSIEFSDFIEE